jgi:hypothetical protein
MPFRRLAPPPGPIALPTGPPVYVIPCSSTLDPPYSWSTAWWPFPRSPLAFESETRARGTGLIGSGTCWPSWCPTTTQSWPIIGAVPPDHYWTPLTND